MLIANFPLVVAQDRILRDSNSQLIACQNSLLTIALIQVPITVYHMIII